MFFHHISNKARVINTNLILLIILLIEILYFCSIPDGGN